MNQIVKSLGAFWNQNYNYFVQVQFFNKGSCLLFEEFGTVLFRSLVFHSSYQIKSGKYLLLYKIKIEVKQILYIGKINSQNNLSM